MVKTNFILTKKILPTNFYISLKDRILIILGRKKIVGWYDIKKNEINIHLANLWSRHKENFEKELIKTINHEIVHSIIENHFGKRIIHPRLQEELKILE